METFVIRRRGAWKDAAELEAAAGVSLRVGNDEMSDTVVIREDPAKEVPAAG